MALQDELLARMEKDLAALLAQVRALMQRRQFAEASRLLGDGYRQLFGLDRRFLQMMKPEDVAQLLAAPQKLVGFARMMAEEAELLRQQHDLESAAAMARWTVKILEAGQQLSEATLLARLRTMSDLLTPG
jgi:hypothetical protein